MTVFIHAIIAVQMTERSSRIAEWSGPLWPECEPFLLCFMKQAGLFGTTFICH